MPFFNRPGVEVAGQARFHPRLYLAALATRVDGNGSHVFENTESEEVVDDPLSIKAGGRTITCDHIVIATHTPLMGKTNIVRATLFQSKLFLYSSYVIAGRVPSGTIPDALFWDTSDPYYYLRLDRRRDYDIADLWRAGSQDRPGRRHRIVLRHAGANGARTDSQHRHHASVVRTGHRNQRRTSLHR